MVVTGSGKMFHEAPTTLLLKLQSLHCVQDNKQPLLPDHVTKPLFPDYYLRLAH